MNLRRKIQLFLLSFLLPFISFGQCPLGNVQLFNQEDVESFIQDYGTCEVIDGNFQLGSEVTDISDITAIKRITGSLVIKYSKITNISNFESLEFVGGDFKIENCQLISSVQGLNNLNQVNGDFSISENGILHTIIGFQNLELIEGNLKISNYQLENMDIFRNLLYVKGAFGIYDNNSLKRIDGFNNLKKIGSIYGVESVEGSLLINRNESLLEISGFDSLKEIVRDINIIDNRSLQKIKGYSNLNTVIHNFKLEQNPNLIDIPDFEDLQTIGSDLSIYDNGIKEIDGFNNLHVIGDLDTIVGNLTIGRNENLISVSGFINLEKLYGQLEIILNEKLSSLEGFHNLVHTRSVNVNTNPSLQNLHGFEKLFTVGFIGGLGVGIQNNQQLVDCSAICNLLTNGTVKGRIQISNNPSSCSSEAEIRNECIPDFDNDGILDEDDLDDDNDGILDSLEQNGSTNRDTDSDNFPDHMDLDSDNDGCYDVLEAGFSDNDMDGVLGNSPVETDENGLVINISDGYSTPLDSNTNGSPDFQEANTLNAGINSEIKICENQEPFNLFDELDGNPSPSGNWTPSLKGGNGIFDLSKDSLGIYTYTVNNGICGDDTATVSVSMKEPNNAGENTLVKVCKTENPFRLLDRINGDPMTGGTWSPEFASGTDQFDPLLDTAGVYNYMVSNNSCKPVTSQITIEIEDSPNPGENGVLQINVNNDPVYLFEYLEGNPDTGGVWEPPLSNSNGEFDPKLDKSGTYRYIIANTPCGELSSEVDVLITTTPNAGSDISLEICENTGKVDLLQLIPGNPDNNGIWSPTLSGELFDPRADKEGKYLYVVENEFGEKDSAEIYISITPAPNSGVKNSIKICRNADPVNLFNVLDGNPEPNGDWSPSLSNGNVFDPSYDSPGIFTYQVSNSCGSSTTLVEVSIDEVEVITDYEIQINEFGDNNSIKISINSNATFEYSLDGITFQSSNLFSSLPGGNYDLTARELDGCRILKKSVSILDYQKFFTPNNDGYNDYWNMVGTKNQDISYIKIFDRYGKLLKNLDPKSKGWDGIYRGKEMPADDYWFKLLTKSNVLKTGHFSLIR